MLFGTAATTSVFAKTGVLGTLVAAGLSTRATSTTASKTPRVAISTTPIMTAMSSEPKLDVLLAPPDSTELPAVASDVELRRGVGAEFGTGVGDGTGIDVGAGTGIDVGAGVGINVGAGMGVKLGAAVDGIGVGAGEGAMVETEKSTTETPCIVVLPLVAAAADIAEVRLPSVAELAKVVVTESARSAPEDSSSAASVETMLMEKAIDAEADRRRPSFTCLRARRGSSQSVSLNSDVS